MPARTYLEDLLATNDPHHKISTSAPLSSMSSLLRRKIYCSAFTNDGHALLYSAPYSSPSYSMLKFFISIWKKKINILNIEY